MNNTADQRIIKCELLLTYQCNLKCSYCNMVDNTISNIRSLTDWGIGLQNVKDLGASFVALYGAEPMMEMDKLKGILSILAQKEMDSTLITNCSVPNVKWKLERLVEHGLKSLTASYDPVPYDNSSLKKSRNSLEVLSWFKETFPDQCRDVAAVVTVTSASIPKLLDTAIMLSEAGIWMFADLAHWNKGNPGTKCKGKRTAEIPYDLDAVLSVYNNLLSLKRAGYLIHIDENVVNTIEKDRLEYNWKCTDSDSFPSWITIGPDGTCYPCDDFRDSANQRFDMIRICDEWEDFSSHYKKRIEEECFGCLWSTHVQAVAIKEGRMNLSDYIHGK